MYFDIDLQATKILAEMPRDRWGYPVQIKANQDLECYNFKIVASFNEDNGVEAGLHIIKEFFDNALDDWNTEEVGVFNLSGYGEPKKFAALAQLLYRYRVTSDNVMSLHYDIYDELVDEVEAAIEGLDPTNDYIECRDNSFYYVIALDKAYEKKLSGIDSLRYRG